MALGRYYSYEDAYNNPTGHAYDSFNDEEKAQREEDRIRAYGQEVPEKSNNRSMLDRIVDAVSVTTYPIMGALKNATDKGSSTSVLDGIVQGFKAANPFGAGNEKGEATFSDTLNNLGWKSQENPEGKWYNPLTWNANNFAKGTVGFIGDVLLDPATYLTLGTGAVLKGSGASAARTGAKATAREGFESALDNIVKRTSEVAGDGFVMNQTKDTNKIQDILKEFGQDSSAEMADNLANKIRRTAGYEDKVGRGLSWGIGDKRITFASDEALRKLGDRTVAPFVNEALAKLGESKLGQTLSGMKDAITSPYAKESMRTARENPELFARHTAWKMQESDAAKTFQELQDSFKSGAKELFQDLSPETRNEMTRIMESPGAFKLTNELVPTGNFTKVRSEEAKTYYDVLNQTKTELERVLDKYNKYGESTGKVNRINDLIQKIDNITKAGVNETDNVFQNAGEMATSKLNDLNNVLNNDSEFAKTFSRANPTAPLSDSIEEMRNVTNVKMSDHVLNRFADNSELVDQFGNPDAIKHISEQVKNDFKKWGDIEGIPNIDQTIETYVTHMMRDKLTDGQIKKIEEETGKKFEGGFENVFAKERTLDDKFGKTIEQINRAMKEKYNIDKFFETDIGRIYLNRGLKHNQYVFNKNYYEKLVNTFGQHIDKVSDIPITDKIYASTQDISKILADVEPSKLNEVLDTLKISKNIKDTFKPIVELDADAFVRLKNMDNSFKAFTMPKLLAEDVNKSGKILYDELSNPLLNMYDKFLQSFKVNATAVNPGFHIRNFISNQFQNFLNVGIKALDPQTQYMGFKLLSDDTEYLKKTMVTLGNGKEVSLMDVKNMMNKMGTAERKSVAGTNSFQDSWDSFTKNNVDQEGNLTKRLTETTDKKTDVNAFINPLSKVFDIRHPFKTMTQTPGDMLHKQWLPYEVGKSVGSVVENQARAVNFLANLMEHGDYFKAAENTNKFLFDYSDLSDLEKNVFKRVVPFYTWMRKNTPLQLKMLIEKPQIYSGYAKAKREIERSIPEDQRLNSDNKNEFAQDWIQLPFSAQSKDGKTGDVKNNPMFLNPSLPLADLARLNPSPSAQVRQLISSTSPLIKAAIELPANKNFYFNSPISKGESDTKDAPAYLQGLLGGTPDEPAQISPEARYILQNLAPSLENAGKLVDKTKTSDEEAIAAAKILGGVGAYSFDAENFKKTALKNRLSQLKRVSKMAQAEEAKKR